MEQFLDFLDKVIFAFEYGEDSTLYVFRYSNLIFMSIVLLAALFTFRKYKQLIKQLTNRFEIADKEQETINRSFRFVLLIITAILFLRSVGIELNKITDYQLHKYDCVIENVPEGQWKYELRTVEETGEKIEDKTKPIKNSQTREVCKGFDFSNILNSIIVFLIGRIVLWTLLQLLGAYYKRENMDIGSQYAINRLIKYVIYTIMILTIIETLGFQLTVLWGAAGALLVGFGLGLQQTFNDLFSGILIMVEGSVHVGDMVKVKGQIGRVTKIGIRASEVRMRDDVEFIVPNSHLVMDGIANWNHSDQKARFFVTVGVAYGSDTQLVKKILLDIAAKNSKVIDYPEPIVHFADFGNSSLDFELHFWTFDVFGVLNTQSDLRFEIDKAFREHKIEIPYPQRDLWIRNPKDLK